MIEVKNVTKKYGKFIAVDNISFTINEGEIIGLLGPNGAGKSTTMNMLTGFIEQTEGEIIIDGYNTLKKPKKAKKEIGYMPEGVPLYTDLTVKEFITYMAEIKNVDRKNRKEKVQEIINKTGLKDVQKKLIKNLSRGYKQRVSMAGALIGDPKILILDEPTAALGVAQTEQPGTQQVGAETFQASSEHAVQAIVEFVGGDGLGNQQREAERRVACNDERDLRPVR